MSKSKQLVVPKGTYTIEATVGQFGPSDLITFNEPEKVQTAWQEGSPPAVTGHAAIGSMPAPYRLQKVYQTGEETVAAIEKAKPFLEYSTTVDGTAYHLGTLPVLRFGSDDPNEVANPMVRCSDDGHPYWKEVEGIVNPTAPGDTQVTSAFVPGASDSTNMTGAPMPPKVVTPEPPSAPSTPLDTTPRAPVTHFLDPIPWQPKSTRDTHGVFGSDLMELPINIPPNFRGWITLAGVNFPAGDTPHTIRVIKDGQVVVDHKDPAPDIDETFTVPGQLSPGLQVIAIQCVGESYRKADIRLDVTIGS